MDGVAGFESVELNSKLFWEKGAFLLLGPSGTGKTTVIKTALSQPGKYMDLPADGAFLWVFPGASHDLQPELEKVLDKSVFKEVKFVKSRIGECKKLKEALAKNKGKNCHVIILDDYMTYTKEDARFVKELLMHHKRHQRLCFVVATHQLRKDRTGITYDLLDHADRILFCRSPKNLSNLKSFAVRREASPASKQAMAAEFVSGGGDGVSRPRYGLSVFDACRCLFIVDYHAFEGGRSSKASYAYGKRLHYILVTLALIFTFQNSAVVRPPP